MVIFTEIPLKDLADIGRGAVTKPADIQERTATELMPIRYLTVSDIQDNYILPSLRCLKNIEEREIKYCLKENDIVVAKMGQPKIGLVGDIGENKIILSQNLYVLRPDMAKINPVYLRAFFESPLGMERLAKAYVKSTIPTLPIRNLESLTVPVPTPETELSEEEKMMASLELQNSFAELYKKSETKEFEYKDLAEQEKERRVALFEEFMNNSARN